MGPKPNTLDRPKGLASALDDVDSSGAVILFIIAFGPLAAGGAGFPAVALIQATLLLLAALWGWSVLDAPRCRIHKTFMDLPLLAIALWVWLSLAWSPYAYATWVDSIHFSAYVILFFIASQLLRMHEGWLDVVRSAVVFGGAYAAAALWQFTWQFTLQSAWQLEPASTPGLRATFSNPSHFAGYLNLMCWLSVGLAASSRGLWRWIAGISALCCAAAVCLSLSISAVLGLIASFLFLLVCFSTRAAWRSWAGVMLVSAGWLWTALAWISAERFRELRPAHNNFLESGGLRIEMWRESLALIGAKPWIGWGFGAYREAAPEFQRSGTVPFAVNHPHNEYLEWTAELGICGAVIALIAVTIFFVSSLRGLYRQSENKLSRLGLGAMAACVSWMIQGIFDFQMAVPSNALLFTLCAAIAVRCVSSSETWIDRLWTGRGHRSAIASSSLVGACGILILLPIWIGGTATQIMEARPQLTNWCLKVAAKLDRDNSAHIHALGSIWRRRGLREQLSPTKRQLWLERAADSYEKVIDLRPRSVYALGLKADVLTRLGQSDEARDAFKKASELAPRRFSARYRYAGFLMGQQESAEASREVQAALESRLDYLGPALDKLRASHGASYEQLAQAVPMSAAARAEFASYLLADDKRSVGLVELGRAFILDPSVTRAAQHVKAVMEFSDSEADAERVYRKYAEQFPADDLLWQIGAELLARGGRFDEVTLRWRRLLREDGSDADRYLALEGFFTRFDEPQAAIEILREAIAEGHSPLRVYRRLADRLDELGQHQEAVETLWQASVEHPTDAALAFRLASSLKKAGRERESLEALVTAVRLAPDEAVYRDRLQANYDRLNLELPR